VRASCSPRVERWGGTEDVVRAAGLTRGALYHHFADKQALFAAVFERLEQDLVASIGATMAVARNGADPVGWLAAGMSAYLDACIRPAVVRISLVDAPTVLGWARWREVGDRYGLGVVTAALEYAMAAGALRPQPARPLAHLLLAALGEAALLSAHAEDSAKARADVEPALLAVLHGLRA
jgi:AcrR family transcriptional regulator